MDKLSQMFSLQKELNKRIGVDTDSMDDDKRVEWILNYSRALGQELAELVDSVPWKWWAKYQTFDKQNARVEIVDLFHFLISLAQTAGLTADDVFDLYTKKNKVNHNRQDSGYEKKDEADNISMFAKSGE
ncbi:MAG: dUTPase [Candidatus Auribacterota bacterium]|jgi:dimeric dUTPase (all-alpha-NTP-PPase superfamily)|nr:dUTPase [Candidatus Auribacterota bacterium]